MTVLMPLAMTMDVKLESSKEESSTISWAKKTPAMGALKVAATPPETPQATSVLSRSPLILKDWPTWLPMAPPIWAMGPSCPADPPVPMVMQLAMPRVKMVRPGILAPFRLTSSRSGRSRTGDPWRKIVEGDQQQSAGDGKEATNSREGSTPRRIWNMALLPDDRPLKEVDQLAEGVVAEPGGKADGHRQDSHEGIFADAEAAQDGGASPPQPFQLSQSVWQDLLRFNEKRYSIAQRRKGRKTVQKYGPEPIR
jgi:hypothetical protein